MYYGVPTTGYLRKLLTSSAEVKVWLWSRESNRSEAICRWFAASYTTVIFIIS